MSINDAGLSTDWKVGVLNPIILNLETISIKLDAKSIKSLINNFCLCLIKFFTCSYEDFDIINQTILIGNNLLTIIISYIQQIPWNENISIIILFMSIDEKIITYHCSNSYFFTQHWCSNRYNTATHTEPSI